MNVQNERVGGGLGVFPRRGVGGLLESHEGDSLEQKRCWEPE